MICFIIISIITIIIIFITIIIESSSFSPFSPSFSSTMSRFLFLILLFMSPCSWRLHPLQGWSRKPTATPWWQSCPTLSPFLTVFHPFYLTSAEALEGALRLVEPFSCSSFLRLSDFVSVIEPPRIDSTENPVPSSESSVFEWFITAHVSFSTFFPVLEPGCFFNSNIRLVQVAMLLHLDLCNGEAAVAEARKHKHERLLCLRLSTVSGCQLLTSLPGTPAAASDPSVTPSTVLLPESLPNTVLACRPMLQSVLSGTLHPRPPPPLCHWKEKVRARISSNSLTPFHLPVASLDILSRSLLGSSLALSHFSTVPFFRITFRSSFSSITLSASNYAALVKPSLQPALLPMMLLPPMLQPATIHNLYFHFLSSKIISTFLHTSLHSLPCPLVWPA